MNRAGDYRTNLDGLAQYRSYKPNPMPPDPKIDVDDEMLNLLLEASKKIGALNNYTCCIPNVDLFISMYVRKEALLSSQIEGTQATLEDIFNPAVSSDSSMDITDVVNYVKATNYALNRMNELPLCNRLLRETHKILLDNVRGNEKNPGEFRTSQNWIGAAGCTINTAKYVPPCPEDMNQAMSDFEKYINDEEETVALVRAALMHYQFETIHPFLDGNGRIGRLLITLYLIKRDVLSAPVLYVSYYLKKNRVEYYDRLSEVRRTGNFEQWVKFFLRAICESADDALMNIDKMIKLHNANTDLLKKNKVSKNTMKLFDFIEQNPIINVKNTAEKMDVSFNTADSAIKTLVKLKILCPADGKARNRTFVYEDYINILRSGTELETLAK